MKYTLLLVTGFLLATCMSGCKDDPVPPVSRTGPPVARAESDGPSIARRLSLNVQDLSYRMDLKKYLLEKFDGDYNVLWSRLEGQNYDPLLQVAMPSLSDKNTESWDAGTHIPIVVYRPPDADLNKLQTLTAFRNGEEISFDITREPDQLVLVISHNERVIAIPRNKIPDLLAGRSCLPDPILTDDQNDYYLKQDVYDCLNVQVSTEGSDASGECDRDQPGGQDHLIRARFATIDILRQAEHYLDGNPEVFFFVTLASKNPSGFSSLRKSYPSSDRSEWKDCGLFRCKTEWYDKTLPVFSWDRTLFGDLVRYDWFEEDYSKAKIDLTLGLTTKILDVNVSGGVKITINEKDFFLDQDFVSYCDTAGGIGTTYNTGKFLFTVNHQ